MEVEDTTIIGLIIGIPIAIIAIAINLFYLPTLPTHLHLPFLLYFAIATGLVQCWCCVIAHNMLIRSNSERDD